MSDEINNNHNNQDESKYDLYTEHIVPDSNRRIKKLAIKAGYFAGMAIFFGLVAGLVMVIVYKTGSHITETDPTKESVTLSTSETSDATSQSSTHETVTIATSEAETTTLETETELQWNDEIKQELSDVTATYQALKNVSARVNQSSVTVTATEDGVDWFNSSFQNQSNEYGIIIAKDAESYYIMTDYSLVDDAGSIYITYGDGTQKTAELMAGDTTTGLAVVKTEIMKSENIRVAVLADSTTVSQGDVLVAVGKLYGFMESMGYGIATGINNLVTDTDSAFELITTSISGTETSTGVIANLNGDVVGIITTNYNTGTTNLISAYTIEDLHSRMENMMNGKEISYIGIKGQEVTQTIMDSYDIPAGIYVSAVESNSPAYTTGIQTGDIITKINGASATSMTTFETTLSELSNGDTAEITVKRKGRDSYKEIVFTVTLGVE